MKRNLSISAFIFLLVTQAIGAQGKTWDYKYCIPVKKIDFNPFRTIEDGKDLAYLLLLKSYISTDPAEPGILSSYEFSPDGKIFTGRLAVDSKWNDGAPVKPHEAALGIAKALSFRTLGKRVQVVGTEKIQAPGWEKKSYAGIEILDSKTFRLKFHSDISNLTGVLREALSTNSRHNRFWPVRLSKRNPLKTPEVLGKFPIFNDSGASVISVHQAKVLIADAAKCSMSDFSAYPENLEAGGKDFLKKLSPNPSAVTIQMNTEILGISDRVQVIQWVREAFAGLPEEGGIKSVPSFFLPGETGYESSMKWSVGADPQKLNRLKLRIAFEIPIYKTILESAAKKAGVELTLIPLPKTELNIHAQILSSGMTQGRHIILQDILQWPHVNEFIKSAPKTRSGLSQIAERSASTLPPDQATLKEFEKKAHEEQSLAPVARRYPIAFSKPALSVCLSWTAQGELTFLPKAQCSNLSTPVN